MARIPMIPPHDTPSPGERRVRLRLMLLALGVCLWAGIIVVRLVQLQVLDRPRYEVQAARQSERTINLDPRRGPIVDRNGRQLAVSVDVESIYAVPTDIDDPVGAAARLAGPLGLDAAGRRALLAQLQKTRAFVWVRRKVDAATAQAVRDLQLEGVGFVTENRRYYPQKELASQVIGYVGLDNTGMSGIEYAFEEDIKGRAAKMVIRTDARRRPLGHIDKPSTDGHTVVLTLDESIQHVAERELERAVSETGSIGGMAIVMDPHTGEVLALAHRPTFNPNRFQAYPSSRWRNRAVADSWEPGSIFKIFTAAAALSERVVDPEETIDCGHGFVEIAGLRINDHNVFDQLRFKDVLAKSSDVGVIRVAQRLGRENFNRYMRSFGFGEATGVDLPGEATGLLRPPQKWSALSLASLSFGQEIGVTAMQLAAAVSAVANGGTLMRPAIVRHVEDRDGGIVRQTRPAIVRRVIEQPTVTALTAILEGVVEHGTGTRAAIPGYAVAGKTGTAQKVDPSGRYSMVDHIASFVGYVPARRPAIVVLVSLDTPRGPRNQGGDVAAPLFARIAEPALRRLAIPPDDASRVLMAAAPATPTVVPAAWTPSAPDVRPADLPVETGTVEEAGRMPDLLGRSAREAAIAAARRGLVVELAGSGRVTAQTPEAGAAIEPGMTCRLELSR